MAPFLPILLIFSLITAVVGCQRQQSGLPSHIIHGTPLPLPAKPQADNPPENTYLVGTKALTVKAKTPAQLTSAQLQKASARTLAQLGQPAVPTLVQMLNRGTPEEQQQAAASLAWMGPAAVSATEPLVVILENPATPPPLQVACIRAIGEIGPAIWPTLPTRPTASVTRTQPQLDAAGAGQANEIDPAEAQWQADQRAYQADMAEYERRTKLAQRAVAIVAQILRQQSNS